MADGVEVINLKKLKVAELKKELADRGLTIKGNKSDLQARLEKCLSEQGVVVSQDESEEITDDHDEHDVEDDLDNDADDLDDVDDGEDVSEHLDTEDLTVDEQTKEKEVAKVNVTVVTEDQETPTSPVKRVPITPPGKKAGEETQTDEQKKAQRMARFGQSAPATETDKKQARAQRFGVSSGTSNGTAKSSPIVAEKDVDVEKLKKRADRFGAVSPVMTKIEESDKLLKRKQRFGVAVAVVASPGDVDAKKQKRAERFGL